MSGENNGSAKRSHRKYGSAFPDNLEIPESAIKDRKFLSSYVRILNDPRVHKRRRLNGDRTSSRFDVDYNVHIKVVYNEPVVKRKSILTNTQTGPKAKQSLDDSGKRKSVSFLSKITFIDSIDLDGGSSDWTDFELDDKKKEKSKSSKGAKMGKDFKPAAAATITATTATAAASNDMPSSKNHKKKKTKEKPPVTKRAGPKSKSAPKELLKFKITKPFRKFGRSKEKKLKHLQKKFGRRMFKAFVHVKRSFNLQNIPDTVAVPLEKVTLNPTDVTTPEKCVPSIQDCLINQMTKMVKVSLSPVQRNTTGDTNEARLDDDTEIMQGTLIESNSADDKVPNCTDAENDVQRVSPADRHDRKELSEPNIAKHPSVDVSAQSNKINGDSVSAGTIHSPDKVNEICSKLSSHSNSFNSLSLSIFSTGNCIVQ